MKLYKVVYTQNSEAFVQAENGSEAIDFITELTENGGGDKMSSVRLNECGWFVEEELGELVELSEEELQEDQFNTHKAEGDYGISKRVTEGDYGMFWD
jgi:hypothetical protein